MQYNGEINPFLLCAFFHIQIKMMEFHFSSHRMIYSIQAEQQKKAAIIAAEGDATAAQLLAKSFGEAGEGLVELRRIEAAEDIAYQLSRSRQVSYLPPGQNVLLNLPA